MTALDRQANDLSVHPIPPAGITDPRVPLAEEFTLQGQIVWQALSEARDSRWMAVTEPQVLSDRVIQVGGSYLGKIYPGKLEVDATIQLNSLPDVTSIVKRDDRVFLVVFAATVGSEHDADLGKIDYEYFDTTDRTIKPIQKENSLRDRAYWILVVRNGDLTVETFYNALPKGPYRNIPSIGQLQIQNANQSGFALGQLQIYASDPLLTVGASFPINPAGIEIVEVCRVRRIQNYTDRGYTWGRNGEYPLTQKFCIVPISQAELSDLDTRIRQRVLQLFSGTPGVGGVYERTVQNLTAGQYGGNPGRAGEAAGSPNGSVCLANSERVTFTNQAFTQTTGIYTVTAASDNAGNSFVSISLNTNAPAGSVFSENPADHKIWSAIGIEESALGSFVGLGGNGVLTWIGTQNSSIRPGQQVYVQPAIKWSAGSGFSVPFDTVEQAWRNGVAISPENILMGDADDFENATGQITFREPVNGESYLLVFGRERAALHYIYKRVNLTSDSSGMVTIPGGERGCIAIIQGVNTRIDAPIYKGLPPNTTVAAYIYYPPRTSEVWQFQMSYPAYAGTGTTEPDFLNGATVISAPYLFLTTQGSGNSVFQGDASLRYAPISLHLPISEGAVSYYQMDAPLRFSGEPSVGSLTYREIPPLSGAGLALPFPGQVLQSQDVTPSGLVRTLPKRITSNGSLIGFRTPSLTKRKAFQAILVFAVENAGEQRLVIATRTGIGGENVALDASTNVAIDTVRI